MVKLTNIKPNLYMNYSYIYKKMSDILLLKNFHFLYSYLMAQLMLYFIEDYE